MAIGKFTNDLNIPQHIVDAIIQDDHYTNGDISVTQLIDSPQIRILKKMHVYDMDVSDLIAAFMGTGLHTALERADTSDADVKSIKRTILALEKIPNQEKGIDYLKRVIDKHLNDKIDKNMMKEVNLAVTIDGMQISGTFDLFFVLQKSLEDYKQTKVSAFMMPEQKKSWVYQLNIYAFMLREHGFEVESAKVHAFLKDWSEAMMSTRQDYPRGIYQQFVIPLQPQEKVRQYIQNRVALHKRAEETGEAVCTPKDTWARQDTFKVMKKGNVRSKKNMNEQHLAEQWLAQYLIKYPLDKNKMFIEKIPGENLRCAKYCPVAKFCPQRKELTLLALKAEEM